VKRWAACAWREGAIDEQNYLSVGVSHVLHAEYLAGVAVLDL
jgi:hypothetical protein